MTHLMNQNLVGLSRRPQKTTAERKNNNNSNSKTMASRKASRSKEPDVLSAAYLERVTGNKVSREKNDAIIMCY